MIYGKGTHLSPRLLPPGGKKALIFLEATADARLIRGNNNKVALTSCLGRGGGECLHKLEGGVSALGDVTNSPIPGLACFVLSRVELSNI